MAWSVEKKRKTSQWIRQKTIGSNWLLSSLDYCVAVNEVFQGKRISSENCKHLLVLCMDFDHLL